MLGPALVRRYVALDRLTINNEIAGFKFATVGVLYAVPLAFVIIVVWEKFSDAEANVVREAGAAENLYRLSEGLGDYSGPDLRKSYVFLWYGKSAGADADDGAAIFSELLVVIVIDRPFTGAVKVPPTALAEVLADLESQPDESR
jgi:hypothetical protein